MDNRPPQSGPAKPVIDVRHLTKRFGAVTAVEDVSFQVHEGEIFGFLGPNGAGKTTTMRMLCCLISATSGDVHIGGYDIAKPEDSLPIRQMIGLMPDNVGLYNELSAYDNLDFYGKLYDCPQAARETNIERYLTLLGLWDKRDRAVGSFSKGMQQKVAVARALIHDPAVLFLDEPTASLDPESAKVVTDVILQLRRAGKTIVLNTHNLDEAQRICDRIGILKTKLLTVSTPEQLRKAVWGNRTVLRLAAVDDHIVAAIERLKPKNLVREGTTITVDVDDPLAENPELVQAVVAAGGRIQYVTELSPALAETYLRIIEEETR
ncbi:MAG TPA: ABC transporter ATP-binding protein [Chloroflexota bacterium]|nr:ABC transporter ATP-binding protein [Chloroflexota bacterium]